MSTEDEARKLITLACPLTDDSKPYAPELVEEQTLENLERFSDRLAAAHQRMIDNGTCKCQPVAATKEQTHAEA